MCYKKVIGYLKPCTSIQK